MELFRTSTLRRLSTLLVLLFFVGFTAACESEPEMEEPLESETEVGTDQTMPEQGEMIDEIANNPDQYMGQTVTVTGEIDEYLGDNVFSIQGEGLTGYVYVFVPSGVTASGELNEETEVQVSGTVRQFTMAEYENDYGLDEYELEIEDQDPIIVANSVTIMAADESEVF